MYTVYKIVNKINQKFYVGVHKTDNPNDSYMGSGKAIKRSIQKYGKENFKKDVLLITENEDEAFSLEKELTSNYTDRDNYNMKLGGVGGFTKENAKKGYNAVPNLSHLGGKASMEKLSTEERKEKARNAGEIGGKSLKGKPKSEVHKQALRDSWKKKQNLV